LLAFPESFAKHEQTLKPGTPLLLKVRVQIEEAGTRLSLQEARRIQDLAERAAAQQEFRVRLSMTSINENTLERLEELFTAAPGMSQVVFELESSDGTIAVVASQQRVKASPELSEAVRRIRGEAAAA
jgi:DNA polymerase III alpha subunit